MGFWDEEQVDFFRIFTTQASSVCGQAGPNKKID